jgi:hypothetical protein
MGAVKFCKVPKYRENEIFEREKVTRIQGMYLGESGTIYFVQEDFENSIENDKKICYNNNINKKVTFIEPILKNEMKKEQEENPFINLDVDWGL